MEESDASTRSALLAFTLHMATGNTDAAHKAMRAIKSPAVWESMATVCVKSGNLPVLQLCLANMENVRGARALRAQEVCTTHIPLEAHFKCDTCLACSSHCFFFFFSR